MRWIFDECIDLYGYCIRQYTFLAISFIISLLAVWSCYQTYKREKKLTFQLIPLIINFLTTLMMFFLLLLAQQLYNTYMLIMSIQIYSYFLLAYAFLIKYLNQDKSTKSSTIRTINVGFVLITIGVVLIIVTFTVLSYLGILKCQGQDWIGTLVLFGMEIPIYVIMFIYSTKAKQRIKKYAGQQQQSTQKSQMSLHLLNKQDSYISLQILQINLVIVTFTITLVMHLCQLILQIFVQNRAICLQSTNKIIVTDLTQLLILILDNLSELFPHLMIPFIFWYIPNKLGRRTDSLYIIPRKIGRIDSEYNVDPSSVQIYNKFKH